MFVNIHNRVRHFIRLIAPFLHISNKLGILYAKIPWVHDTSGCIFTYFTFLIAHLLLLIAHMIALPIPKASDNKDLGSLIFLCIPKCLANPKL